MKNGFKWTKIIEYTKKVKWHNRKVIETTFKNEFNHNWRNVLQGIGSTSQTGVNIIGFSVNFLKPQKIPCCGQTASSFCSDPHNTLRISGGCLQNSTDYYLPSDALTQ